MLSDCMTAWDEEIVLSLYVEGPFEDELWTVVAHDLTINRTAFCRRV
jgi:hypothetical protein